MAIATAAQLTQITSLYVSLFNRAPDTAGLSFWSSALANGASFNTITQGFLTAPEGQANYPQFQGASEFVTAFYTKVFGRAPDAGGLTFWTAALNGAGGASSDAAKATVVGQIVAILSTPLTSRPEGLTDAQYLQTSNDRALFANKLEVGTYLASYSTVLDTNTLLAGVTANPQSVFTVKNTADLFGASITASLATTTGAAVVGSNAADVFSLSTAQLADADTKAGFTLEGGAGVDTLRITTTGTTSISDTIKSFTNIELIGISTVGGETTTVSTGKFVGATTFTAFGNGSTIFNGLAAGQAVALNNSNGFLVAANYLAAATAASVTFSGGNSGNLSITGTGLTSATINSTGASFNSSNSVTLAGTIGAVTVNASTAFTSSLSGAKAGAVLTVTGGGRVELNSLPAAFTTVNAGAATGGLILSIESTVTSLIGSAGADEITLNSPLAAGASISLGAGNDLLLVTNTGAIAAGSTVDGGAGIDALSSRLITAANASVFKNFELLQIEAGTITDVSLLTGSTLTSLILASSGGGGAVNNVASTLGLTVTGVASGITTIGVTGAATNTADVYTITLANPLATGFANAGTVALANVETINLVSGGIALNAGTFNSIILSDAALKTLNITGSQAARVTFTTATTATSLVDGSAATGVLTINTANLVAATAANGGLTVKGGTAADLLTIAQGATVTGGAGVDVFTVTSKIGALGATDITTAAAVVAATVTITDFAKGESLVLSGLTAVATTVTFTDQSTAASLFAAANASITPGLNSVSAFRFAGDTYIVANVETVVLGSFGAGDVLVKLAGVVDTSSFTHATGSDTVVFG